MTDSLVKRLRDALNDREFYEVMLAYRHADKLHTRPADTVESFEAVKEYVLAAVASALTAQPSMEPVVNKDRQMLEYLMQQFDGEVFYCPCGRSEPTKDCDSAQTLRDYLAEHPAPHRPDCVVVPRDDKAVYQDFCERVWDTDESDPLLVLSRGQMRVLFDCAKAALLAAAPAAPVDEQTDREAFEKWAEPLGYDLGPVFIDGLETSSYRSDETHHAWAAWQAARAQRRGE